MPSGVASSSCSPPCARGVAATTADDAMLLFTLERVCDAIADGELRDLDVPLDATIERLRALVLATSPDLGNPLPLEGGALSPPGGVGG